MIDVENVIAFFRDVGAAEGVVERVGCVIVVPKLFLANDVLLS